MREKAEVHECVRDNLCQFWKEIRLPSCTCTATMHRAMTGGEGPKIVCHEAETVCISEHEHICVVRTTHNSIIDEKMSTAQMVVGIDVGMTCKSEATARKRNKTR
jgi:hypothetical protein